MQRNNLTRDKYNVGVGTMRLYAFTSGVRYDEMLKRDILTHSAVRGASMRYHYGNAGKTLVTGRRYLRRVFSEDARMELAMAAGRTGSCPNARAWWAATRGLAKAFDRLIYSDGLKENYEAIDTRGASADFHAAKLLAFETAGRRLFTIQSGDREVTFICAADGESRMGVQSMRGLSLKGARSLVALVASGWALGIRLKPDTEIGIG